MLAQITRLAPDFGARIVPPMPPAADRTALLQHYLRFDWPARQNLLNQYQCRRHRGGSIFAEAMVATENAFRRERGIFEISKGSASEVTLLDLLRKCWPGDIHQRRPPFLGSQSIDIYVPELGLAIEYRGQQHYEPVALFGGEEGLGFTQARDAKKRKLLPANGVRLFE
ncbi:MAG: hypothetical protein JWR80_1603 [Bradyrhizobium sp.]|nr:hypothetical protein [Bradyrhizobium sp.]